jgi:hypothetical protein
MKKKPFLTGILSILLVFEMMLFVGCKTDDDDSGGGGGGGGSGATLVGSAWRTGAPAVNRLYIFTSGNPGMAYRTLGAAVMFSEPANLDTGASKVPITAGAVYDRYLYHVSGDNLVIEASYVQNAAGAAQDITLTRVEGTTGAAPYGIWYSIQASDANSIFLVIRTDNTVYSCVGATKWERRSYTLTGTDAAPLIQWNGGATDAYTFDPDDPTKNVTIGGTLFTKVTLL